MVNADKPSDTLDGFISNTEGISKWKAGKLKRNKNHPDRFILYLLVGPNNAPRLNVAGFFIARRLDQFTEGKVDTCILYLESIGRPTHCTTLPLESVDYADLR